jgi:catechol 2,3-dioxygenase-like lactoylglutathione lyase family enzyme
MTDRPTATVASVVIDCSDLERLVGFWSEILCLEEKVRFPGFVWLSGLRADGPSLALQQVPEAKAGKNRVHLDLAATDPEAFIARVIALGAVRLADHEIEGFHWTVMGDPEGNEFCVTAT